MEKSLRNEVDEPLDDAQERDEGEKEKEQISTTSYTIAKKPPLPNVPISSISEDYGAKDFLLELNKYLQASNIAPSVPPTSESSVSVYKQVTKYLPFVLEATSSLEPIRDTIHTVKSQLGKVTVSGIQYFLFLHVFRRNPPESAGIRRNLQESGNSAGIRRNQPEFRNSAGVRRNRLESAGISL
jgi:hypothetical protein